MNKAVLDSIKKVVADATESLNLRKLILAWMRGVKPEEIKDADLISDFVRVEVVATSRPVTRADFEDYLTATNPRTEHSPHWITVAQVPDNLRFFDRLRSDYKPKSDKEKALAPALRGKGIGFGGITVLDINGEKMLNQIVNIIAPNDAESPAKMNAIVQERSFLHAVGLPVGTIRPILNPRTGDIFPDAVFVTLQPDVAVSGTLQPHPWMEANDTIVDIAEIKAAKEKADLEKTVQAKANALNGVAAVHELTKVLQVVEELSQLEKENAIVSTSTLGRFGISKERFDSTTVGKAQAKRLEVEA